MKRQNVLLRVLNNKYWDLVPLALLIGALANVDLAGVGVVVWAFTLAIRFMYPKEDK